MQKNRAQVMAWVFQHEGGYAERPEEPGGAVNRGISFSAYKAWWKRNKKPGTPTFNDLKLMGPGVAADIYFSQYFAPVHFDRMPSGVDYVLVDWAIHAGPAGAIKAIQRRMPGFGVTGEIDGKLSWALRHRVGMIDALSDMRLDFSGSLKNAVKIANPKAKKPKTWLKIWTERIEKVRSRAKELEIDG